MVASALPRRVLLELTPSEAEFQRRVVGLAKLHGWRCYHAWSSRHSEKGMPDLCLLKPPRLIFAELKVWPRTTPRPEQAAWLADLGAVPGVESYLWVWEWPGDIESDIAAILGGEA